MNTTIIAQVIITYLVIMMGVFFFMDLQVRNGTIVITKPYLQDYNNCSLELESCEDKLTPNCSPCECYSNSQMYFWGILYMGIIFAMVMFGDNIKDKVKKVKKALK